MANGWYKLTKQKAIRQEIDLTANLKFVLTRASGYTPNRTTHEFLSSIDSGARLGISELLTNITTLLGVIDSDDTQTAATVPAGAAINQVQLFQDTGNPATSPLVYSFDTGISYTPDGNKIGITIDPSGICEI